MTSSSLLLHACLGLTMLTTVLFTLGVQGDFGSCRYDTDRCSCKMGTENQGICWDADPFDDTLCHRRFCQSGWTCSCGGRTHVCHREFGQVRRLKHARDVNKTSSQCVTRTAPRISGLDISLGTVKIHVSKRGVQNDDCTQMAWWHNGELLGNRARLNSTEINGNVERAALQDHSLIELRPGDLIAFRFRGGSYYCYKNYAEFEVNTTKLTTLSQGVTTHFARKYTEDWFMPSYKLTGANTGEDESASVEKFVPLRPKKLTTGERIVPGTDYWQRRNDGNEDNKRSNFYFRIQLPKVL